MKKLLLVFLLAIVSTFTFAQDSTATTILTTKEFNFVDAGTLISKGGKIKNIGWCINIGTGAVGSILIFSDVVKDTPSLNKSDINIGTGIIVVGTLTNVILQMVGNKYIKDGGVGLATEGIGIRYILK